MKFAAPVPSSSLRRVLAAVAVAFGLLGSTFAFAAVPSTPVVSVQPQRVADLVMLGVGFDAGLREGMVCRVTRGATAIAEVQLVGLRRNCGAALILTLAPGQGIRAGDVASVKVLKT